MFSLTVSGAIEKDNFKVAILYTIGEDALELLLFHTFTNNDGDVKKMDSILKAFETYCSPPKHVFDAISSGLVTWWWVKDGSQLHLQYRSASSSHTDYTLCRVLTEVSISHV